MAELTLKLILTFHATYIKTLITVIFLRLCQASLLCYEAKIIQCNNKIALRWNISRIFNEIKYSNKNLN